MSGIPFIGRENELKQLNDLLKKKTASLVVIKGRRRIGKSRLVLEFAKNKTLYQFMGLPPSGDIDDQDQRNEFAQQLNAQTDLPEIQTEDWSKLFRLLAERIKQKQCVVLFDEITWMAHKDPTFLGKLKNAWEMYYKKNPKLILVLCGSISTWIEENIISSTGYFGRISQTITLQDLPLPQCNDLLKSIGFNRSPMEKFIILSLTGGIPWYIEQINPNYSASENIRKLCFNSNGLLLYEYKHIFHDLFGKRSGIYSKIIDFLSKGPAEYADISRGINYPSSGPLSKYLEALETAGYIQCGHVWSFKTGKTSRIGIYRLCDNYLRFYFKYMQPNLNQIKKGQYDNISLNALPNWESMIGLQFECLVLNNRNLIFHKLNIRPQDVINDNPYSRHKVVEMQRCQIDYLIQTRLNTLYLCEIKFSKNPIGKPIINEIKEKMERLKIPRGFSCVPVLIHVNGVTSGLEDERYFLEIIDFSEFLV